LKEKESSLADTTVKLNAEMTKRKELEAKLAQTTIAFDEQV
jgi:hypothetical protein